MGGFSRVDSGRKGHCDGQPARKAPGAGGADWPGAELTPAEVRGKARR